MKKEIEATMKVTLVIGGKTLELSEADARKVYSELGKIFKEPEIRVVRDVHPFRSIPQWSQPPTLAPAPRPRDLEITCQTSRFSN